MWFTAGDEVSIHFDYEVDAEYVIPSGASFTVLSAAGIPVEGMVGVELPVDTTGASITLPASVTQHTGDSPFKTLFVSVTFIHDGETKKRTFPVSLMPFVPLMAQPHDVRNELGLDSSELPDDQIQILRSYVNLKQSYGEAFTEALIAGDHTSLAANRAIALSEAIETLNSLQFRVAVKTKSETSEFLRIAALDFNKLRIDLARSLAQQLAVLLGTEELGGAIMVIATPPDVITGG